MRIHFFGAAKGVTGSCYMIETGEHKILVDCGMFQGDPDDMTKNADPFPFNAAELDAVFLTHAHMDHVGRVPMLVKRGYRGPIFATAPTVELARLLWEDMRAIMDDAERRRRAHPERGGSWPMLYDDHDVRSAVEKLQAVEYHNGVDLCAGAVHAEFFDAGHILGSSVIHFRIEDRTIVFSGDLGNDDVPLLRPTDPLGAVDVLVIESTYGDRVHEDLDTRRTILRDLVKETVAKKGVLIIPAFAIERTQEIILTLHHLAEAGEIPRVPMFLDSPLAIAATHVYEEFPQYFNADARKEYLLGHELFALPGLLATKTVDMSKSINDVLPPKVIIAGAGMMTGGRVVHHLSKYLPDPANTVLIVGFQAHGTLGRRLYEGQKVVRIHGDEVHVNAKIVSVGGWSAHADQKKLLSWVAGSDPKPEVIFVTHGEEVAAETLARHYRRDMNLNAQVPDPGQTFDLHVKGKRI
jgi:metallo-beta-lactamase family protein